MRKSLLRQLHHIPAVHRLQYPLLLPHIARPMSQSNSTPLPHLAIPFLTKLRPFSTSDSGSLPPPSDAIESAAESSLAAIPAQGPPLVEDVSNAELKAMMEKYLHSKDEEVLPVIFEAILRRRLSKKHELTDDELLEEMKLRPIKNVKDQDFEEDFEELHDTDEEIENLYDMRPYVEKKMVANEHFNMDDRKWDDLIRDATDKGVIKDTRECEEILEDMLSWDKLLPAEIKHKIEAKFNELEDLCERGEMEPDKAYELFKEFEDNMVEECEQMMAAEEHPENNQMVESEKEINVDDPPGEGPVVRWQTRVVFAPGGDAWHPKNRKVKLAVTVKELGLSKYAARRLRELVGKRYNSGKDELTITSERFEHREENRKDCLRTLYALIEEAMRANKLVEETHMAYARSKIRANLLRLQAKVPTNQSSSVS